MDWFKWLSKTHLHPSLVYQYSLALSNNELEEDDIVYFNHDFLQSIGISLAKHRLEILKLSRPNSSNRSSFLSAVLRTKSCLFSCLRSALRRDRSSAAVFRRRSYSDGMKSQGRRLLLSSSCSSSSSSMDVVPAVRVRTRVRDMDNRNALRPPPSAGNLDEIRWDSLFQDLKPT